MFLKTPSYKKQKTKPEKKSLQADEDIKKVISNIDLFSSSHFSVSK